MAHNVSEIYSSAKVQSRIALAKTGLCAFILLPLINLLSLLIGHAEMYWGYYYENKPLQLHGCYLLVAWMYITCFGLFDFYSPERTNRFSPKIARCFRIGYALVLFVGATIIFGIFYKLNFFDCPINPYFEIDQGLLLVVGFVINVVNIVALYIMGPDKGSWGEINQPLFVINAYRHLKCCCFGAVISILVYKLDQTYGFEDKRDTLLLSYYVWGILYCAYSDIVKFINVIMGNMMEVYRRPKLIVIRSSNNV